MNEPETSTVDKNILGEDRDEIVESIAEETGMTNLEERKMIADTVEKVHLQEKYNGSDLEEVDDLGPSLIEALISRPNTSHGVAVVDNVREKDDGVIQVYFKIKGSEDVFDREYAFTKNRSDELSRMFSDTRSVESREEYEKLVLVTESQIEDPTSLIGKKVPVIPKNSSSKYRIHYPDRDSGFIKRLKYSSIRFILDNNLLSYDPDSKKYDISYTPNRKSWFLVTLSCIISLFLPTIVGVPLFAISFLVFMSVLSLQFVYLAEM